MPLPLLPRPSTRKSSGENPVFTAALITSAALLAVMVLAKAEVYAHLSLSLDDAQITALMEAE